MPCPDHEVLSALADGEVETATRAAIEEHVKECPACSGFVADMRRLNALGKGSLRTMPVCSQLDLGPFPASAPPEPRLLPLAAALAVLSVVAWLVAPRFDNSSGPVAASAARGTAVFQTDEVITGTMPAGVPTGWQNRAFAEWLAQNSARRIPLVALEDIPGICAALEQPQNLPVLQPRR
jgi:anti-sigma factor RsiW